MTIAIDATTPYMMTSGVASVTVSHTVAGSNRYMLVGVARGASVEATHTYAAGPSYNGVAMTLVATVSSPTPNSRCDVYELVAPNTGANNFTFTYSANSIGQTTVMVRSFTGVHQTTPRGTAGTFNTGGSTTSTVNVSSAVDELVVDFLAVRTPGTLTVGAGQTQRINQAHESTSGYGASSDEPGAGTVTMSWTNTIGDESSLIAVPLKPSIDGGAPPYQSTKMFPGGITPMIMKPDGQNLYQFTSQ